MAQMSRQNISNKPIPGNKAVLRKLDTKRRGFTRVEIMFAVAIIALVAMIIVYNVRRRRRRAQAKMILEELRELGVAIDCYFIEFSLFPGSSITFAELLREIKPGTRLYTSGGKDILGNPFIITIEGESPKISDASYEALSDVVPDDFWSGYH